MNQQILEIVPAIRSVIQRKKERNEKLKVSSKILFKRESLKQTVLTSIQTLTWHKESDYVLESSLKPILEENHSEGQQTKIQGTKVMIMGSKQ